MKEDFKRETNTRKDFDVGYQVTNACVEIKDGHPCCPWDSPGMIGISADPCIWKLGEGSNSSAADGNIRGSQLSPFSPHRDFVTKNYESFGICGRKIPIQSDLSAGCEA